MIQYKEVWLVLSREGVVMGVCSSKETAQHWRDNAFLGYYKDCIVKQQTKDIDHWMKKVDDDRFIYSKE